MSVRTNADTPEQTANARRVRRRRHRPVPHRAHVLRGRPHRRDARDDPRRDASTARKAALAKLLPYQRDDFAGIFRALKGYPATIRFLDPPLHEFLPHDARSSRRSSRRRSACRRRRSTSASSSCTSSTRCSASAAAASASPIPRSPRCRRARSSKPRPMCRRKGIKVEPEIMIPLVGFKKELDLQVEVVHRVARRSAWPSRR